MNIRKFVLFFSISLLLAGCMGKITRKCDKPWQDLSEKPRMIAKYTKEKMEVDGQFLEEVWQRCPVYSMKLANASSETTSEPEEKAEVRLAWDKNYLYVGATLEDSDIKAEGKEDNLHHYRLGDVLEVFLRPADQSHYWELYGTPRSKKTAFFFPMRGCYAATGTEIEADLDFDMKVAAKNYGTLNESADNDYYWTAEIAIPVEDLTKWCDKFSNKKPWRILVARYNYSDHLEGESPELSMTPQLSRTSYHLLEEYAVLKLEK